MKHSHSGFTLVELLIVIAIIGIIAAIGYPSYQESVQQSRRSDARVALTEAAARQERLFSETLSYVNNSDRAKLVTNSDGESSAEGYYTISVGNDDCAGPPYNCFTITATAKGVQASDTACATLFINHLGQKGSTGGGDRCW